MHPSFQATLAVKAGSNAEQSIRQIMMITRPIIQASFTVFEEGKRLLPIHTSWDWHPVSPREMSNSDLLVFVSCSIPYMTDEDRLERRVVAQTRYDNALLPEGIRSVVHFSTKLAADTKDPMKVFNNWVVNDDNVAKLDAALRELLEFSRLIDLVGFDNAYDTLEGAKKKRIMDLWVAQGGFDPDVSELVGRDDLRDLASATSAHADMARDHHGED